MTEAELREDEGRRVQSLLPFVAELIVQVEAEEGDSDGEPTALTAAVQSLQQVGPHPSLRTAAPPPSSALPCSPLRRLSVCGEQWSAQLQPSIGTVQPPLRVTVAHPPMDLSLSAVIQRRVLLCSSSPSPPLYSAVPCSAGSVQMWGELLGSLVVSHCRSDRADGLYSTVVVDCGGVALGLVYSSADSVRAACREGRGVYYSRSRKSVWRKGETSGAVQRLLAVALDCDGDALRFTVEQSGAGFCHLNRWTCWPSGGCTGHGAGGVNGLHRTLWERRLHPLNGSYTNRLLSDEGLLNSKVLEEARELVEATTREEVANEAADLLYFASVLLCKADVSWAEVERCLDLRSLRLRRRAGNAKPTAVKEGGSTDVKANLIAITSVVADGRNILG